jgi:hypothetical protein
MTFSVLSSLETVMLNSKALESQRRQIFRAFWRKKKDKGGNDSRSGLREDICSIKMSN